jgi:hypothetical protein
LVCAAIVFACAPRVGRGNADAETSAAARTQRASAAPVGDSLDATLIHAAGDRAATFAFVVTNVGERTEVRFPSGRTHEFVVLDERDREVWRSSTGRLFTQALQTRQLRTGSTLRYEARWKDARPGTYRVIATLNSDTHPQRVESQMEIR